MGDDRVRHVVHKALADGATAYFWTPSKTLRTLGMTGEALGTDWPTAKKRAIELNAFADEVRRGTGTDGTAGPRPGTFGKLSRDFQKSDEFKELGARTRKDYAYYLDKLERDYAETLVIGFTPRVIKTYYRRLRREVSVTWAYHMIATLRAVLSWAVSEDWITSNPALQVRIASPAKRTVVWAPEQAETYIATARKLGWHSVAVMALVFDCISQSPIDVRTLKRKAYDGRTIAITRSKTGVTDAPIPLWPEVKAALDEYLASRPALHPEAPIFVNEHTGKAWVESTLLKTHAEIREAAGLPKKLQLQDFRRTAQTEAGAAGGTADEIRGLARHKTRSAAEHYVHPDARFVESVQAKRLALRNKNRSKGAPK